MALLKFCQTQVQFHAGKLRIEGESLPVRGGGFLILTLFGEHNSEAGKCPRIIRIARGHRLPNLRGLCQLSLLFESDCVRGGGLRERKDGREKRDENEIYSRVLHARHLPTMLPVASSRLVCAMRWVVAGQGIRTFEEGTLKRSETYSPARPRIECERGVS